MPLSIHQDQDAYTVRLEQDHLSDALLAELAEIWAQEALPSLVVLDTCQVTKLPDALVEPFCAQLRRLSASGHKVMLMVSRQTGRALADQGVDRLVRSLIEVELLNADSVCSADAEAGGDAQAILARLLSVMSASTTQSIENYTQTSPLLVSIEGASSSGAEVCSVLEFRLGELTGSLILSFPERTILGIASRIMGQTYDALVPEVRDWASELLNLLSSLGRESLTRENMRMELSLPRLATQELLVSLRGQGCPRALQRFSWENEDFRLEIQACGIDAPGHFH